MSAKLLYSLSDENPDLKKQIGCMNGIFQLFDRHHFMGGRRVNHKRLPPVGQSGINDRETNNALQKPKEKNPKKVVKEKQRISSESSRTSFSSSSCSSTFSSLDCNKTIQLEPPSVSHANFPETPYRETPMNQLNASLQLGRRSADLRDVVKDSIYREARGLSVKTATKEDAAGRIMKHVDSPRPLQLSKSVKPRVSGLNESFQGHAKLREAYEDPNEGKREGRLLAPKDARRLSYDGRESRDAFKSSTKLKELPRLSLDSRERSTRGSTSEFKSKYLSGNEMENGNNSKILNSQQEPGSCKRTSSVVAKLMGLEVLPDSLSTNEGSIGLSKPYWDEDLDPFSRSSTANEIQQNRISGSPRNSHKEPISPRLRNVDSVMKPTSTSRILIEPAPWRQPDGSRGSQKQAFKHQKTPTKASNSSPSVFSEIEKRLAELEFKKSGKDLRALKQILDAMQKTEGILEETQKEDQASASVSQSSNSSPNYRSHDQSLKLANLSNLRGNHPISAAIKGTVPPKTFGSPIVIVKPAKLVRNSFNATSSAIPIEGLSGLRKLQIGDSTDGRKVWVDKQIAKDRTPRNNHFRGTSSRSQPPMGKETTARTLRSTQTSKVPQHRTGENSTSSERSSGALSPRLQQKKLGSQKQSHPTIPSSDSSRTRRQPIESGSPRRKLRPKFPNLQQSDGQLSEITSDTRCSSHQGDTISLQSESDLSLVSQIDTEVTSRDRSDEINGSFFLQCSQKHKNPAARLSENGSMAELAAATPEQPSPVSVLDATFYRDDPPSPVKKISNAFKDDETLNSEEPGWTSLDFLNHLPDSTRPSLCFDIDHKKLENIEQLVQKLRQLNSTEDESSIDNITPLCENTNPNHRYISEILLASGLLLSDLGSGLTTVQLQPSGQPINPNLFLVLEQTKGKTKLSIDDHVSGKTSPSMPSEKTQRKLMFDVVNEILIHKLGLEDSSEPWFLPNKLAGRNPSGQHLLRELCSEIDQLQANNSDCSLEDGNESLQQSTNRSDVNSAISMIVLEIERSIFRDLVSEVVGGEAAGQRVRPSRRCRQLFSK